MSSNDMDVMEFFGVFMEEADEHLTTLEQMLLHLEQRPGDRELLDLLFRAAHSIKGGAATFGLLTISEFTHKLESLLDALRDGRVQVTASLVDLLLRSTDLVRRAVSDSANPMPPSAFVQLETALAAALAASELAPSAPAPAPAAAEAEELRSYRVEFVPGRDVFREGLDPVMFLRELAGLGTIESVALDRSRLGALDQMDPDSCVLGWSLVLRTSQGEDRLRETFEFIADSSQLVIAPLDEVAAAPTVDADEHEPAAAEATPAEAVPAIAEPAPGSHPAGTSAVGSAKGEKRPAEAPGKAAAEPAGSIRVAVDKVDKLMNLVGELVINQSMVVQAAQSQSPDAMARLMRAVSDMERNTRDLQERVMSIRMVPISNVFNRVPRLVRDVAAALGKDVVLEVSGQETELDRGLIEKISDPMTHLVRNAIDHGVETPEQRIAAGKSPRGTVRLDAYHQSGNVIIEVRDDGKGIDTERIRAKAIARGLISEKTEMSQTDIQQLVFAPGLTTAEKVTDVSGRGVGMDVVKRNIQALNGAVSIDSQLGRGTCFRISLPLTLAILDGLCVRVGSTTYVLPLTSIVESLRPRPEQLRRVLGRGELVVVRGLSLPMVRLHERFHISDAVTDVGQGLVVIVEYQSRQIGLLVDELIGQSQVVIKSLETNYRKVDGLMGATILGDGQVGLILDVQSLIRSGVSGAEGGNGARTREEHWT